MVVNPLLPSLGTEREGVAKDRMVCEVLTGHPVVGFLAGERPVQLYSGRNCHAQSVWFSVLVVRNFRQTPGVSKDVLCG